MLARKQQAVLGLIFCFASFLLIFSARGRIAEHASRISFSYPGRYRAQLLPVVEAPPSPEIALQNTAITETTLPAGTPACGFTIFDRLYVRNGTIYVVTSNSSAFPHLKYVISLPEDRVNWKKLDPTDKVSRIHYFL